MESPSSLTNEERRPIDFSSFTDHDIHPPGVPRTKSTVKLNLFFYCSKSLIIILPVIMSFFKLSAESNQKGCDF